MYLLKHYALSFLTLITGSLFLHGQGINFQKITPNLQELDENQVSKIKLFFENLKKTRDEVYGNSHAIFEVIETTTTAEGNKNKKVKYEFWSKDALYYRADSEIIASSNAEEIGTRRSVIVKPEGTATFYSKKPGQPFLLVNLERPEIGYDGFTTMPFFYCSTTLNQLDGIAIAEILFLKELNGVTKKLTQINFEADKCTCSVTCASKDVPFDVSFSFDINRGVCLAVKGVIKDGTKQIYLRDVTNEYDFDKYRQLPARHFEKLEISDKGLLKTLEILTLAADFNSVNLDIFSVPSSTPDKGNGFGFWIRWFMVFTIGSALLATFIIYRHQRTKQTQPEK